MVNRGASGGTDGGGLHSPARGGDQAADQRDQAADQRDRAADRRDQAADRRDQAADQRDQAAERRDQDAERLEGSASLPIAPDLRDRAAVARREAALDRRRASQDREAGAAERIQARLDRMSARADRWGSAKEREAANFDELTGAYLRGAGFAELEREMARAVRTGQPLVVAFVDVDRLKAVNDSRGHAAGDRLLLEVADAIRANLRSYDLIIRYGGDEFVCAVPGLHVDDARERFALLNDALAEAPERGSVTIGLAELQPHDSREEIVTRADAQLHALRGRGR